MDPLLVALVVAGLLVGATGTWSPCGFSMIETIGPTGHTGGTATTLAAIATFGPSAVLGGAITFGSLALIGELMGGGTVAHAIAAVVAVAAAAAEARGVPIVPQVRRQLPIGWRSRAPMPVAAAGYGVLLGLGFTTFILSYGVWALMGIALALGDPELGLALGLAFGLGRAIPIVLLAPLAARRAGERICEAMAMDPRLYRGARLGDALALSVLAVALAGSAAGAAAAGTEVQRGSDPSASGGGFVFERPDGQGVLRDSEGDDVALPGSDPAAGGPWLAVLRAGKIVLLERSSLAEVSRLAAPGTDALALSRGWLVYRVAGRQRDTMRAAPISGQGQVGKSQTLAQVKRPGQLSRPAADRRTVVFVAAKSGRSKLIRHKLRSGSGGVRQTLISTRSGLIAGPSIAGKSIAYVLTTRHGQTIRVKGLGRGKGRSIYRAKPGVPTLWTTAISGDQVLFTSLKGGGTGKIFSVKR